MVCAVPVTKDTEIVPNDELVVKRNGGGSIIDKKPLFSPDGQSLYIVWKNTIRSYSVLTGEQLRDFEGLTNDAVSIFIHPCNAKLLVACSESGELISWKLKSGVINSKVTLGIILQPIQIITFDLLSLKNGICIFASWLDKETNRPKFGTFSLDSGKFKSKKMLNIKNRQFYISVGGAAGSQFIAIVHEHFMFNFQLFEQEETTVRAMHSDRIFTCVTCHPEYQLVLTGDSNGRAVLWSGIFNKKSAVQTIFHWHTLPLESISFTQSGSHFYTGGSENVLVKWDINDSYKRSILPRLSGPICHIAVGPENHRVAVVTRDNVIHIIDAQNRITSTIQELTWGVFSKSNNNVPLTTYEKPFPAGLVYDPTTNAVVLNGRTGHVQFYSTHTKTLLYNIDITAQNAYTPERNLVIVNTSVILLAMGGNHNSSWMITVEHRDDKVTHFESRMKFWEYNKLKQMFSLNTCVEFPHEGRVTGLVCQSHNCNSLSVSTLLCATCGEDNRFKIWSLEDTNNIYKKGKFWQCIGSVHYKNLPVQSISFSMDSSLVACGFGSCVTIWMPDTLELKCALSQFNEVDNVTNVLFGNYHLGHLVIASNEHHLTVWNLLTLRAVWTVPLNVTLLTSDPLSTYIAAFTSGKQLFIFTPDCSVPIYKRDLKMYNILCTTWIPNQNKQYCNRPTWQELSQLYFLDSNQELLCLRKNDEDDVLSTSAVPLTGAPLTPFGVLLASKSSSSVVRSGSNVHAIVGVPGSTSIKELLLPSSHSMPPVHLLSGGLIRALLGLAVQKTNDAPEAPPEEKENSDSSDEEHPKAATEVARKTKPSKAGLAVETMKTVQKQLRAVEKESFAWANVMAETK